MKRDYANLVLRAGLAFAFLYPPLNALSDPNSWLGYFPHVVRAAAESAGIPDLLLLHGFGVVEIVIALWLLSGWRIFWPSCVALLMLAGIVFFDFADLQILFRDISIAAIALALAISSYPFSRPASLH
ncbi:MAG TPA: hypothetical protein VN495_03240 [Candidatus Paceibacterota bacterium]|nr:hypothetical protein [Candidatus Paceibacterota bacterium]